MPHPNAYTILAAFLALACAEGLATELTKKKWRPGYPGTRKLQRLNRHAQLRAARRFGYAKELHGYPMDDRPCLWWENGTAGCCEACGQHYYAPVIEERRARNRRVRPVFLTRAY